MRSQRWIFATLALLVVAPLVRAENTSSQTPIITVVPRTLGVAPGGVLDVDVYLSDCTGLMAYQIKLDVAGGDTGALTLEQFSVDRTRKDFLFKGEQIIEAKAPAVGEIATFRYEGGSSVAEGKYAYLGTFSFRVSEDASGEFFVNINTTEQSLLIHSSAVGLAFVAGEDARVPIIEVQDTAITRTNSRTKRSR